MKNILKTLIVALLFQPLIGFGGNEKNEAQTHLDRAWSLFNSQKYEKLLKSVTKQ